MKNTKVLVLDNNKLIVKMVKKALLENSISGCRFCEESILNAPNVFSAFELFSRHRDIEYVITDINLPHLNGDDLIEVLEDTGKLQDTKVVFITTANVAKKINKNSLKRSIGVIHKPFNNISFNESFNELLVKKKQNDIQSGKIREKQKVQKELIINILNNVFEKKYQNKISTKQITDVCEEYFHTDEDIEETDMIFIAYHVANEILDKLNKKVDFKYIECAFHKKSNIYEENEKKEFFNLKKTFQNSIENMKKLQKTNYKAKELLANTDAVLNKVKNKVVIYPSKKFDLYYPHLHFIIDEFSKNACIYKDHILTSILANINELKNFKELIHSYRDENKLNKDFFVSAEFDEESKAGLFKIMIKIDSILEHYIGWIELYMWKRFFCLKELRIYREKYFEEKLPNTFNMLLAHKKVNLEQSEKYKVNNIENIAVLSNDVDILAFFRDKMSKMKNYKFNIFNVIKLLEVWTEKNSIDRIIIDFDFKINGQDNALEFLSELKKDKSYFNLFYMHRIYILLDSNNFEMFNKKKLNGYLIHKKDLTQEVFKKHILNT